MEIKNNVLVALAGLSGVGKSFFINLLTQKARFKPLPSVTTRKPRVGELEGKDKFFVDDFTFKSMNEKRQLICVDEMIGYSYGTNISYAKKMLCQTNLVGQFRYSNFAELKEKLPTITIYLYAENIEQLISMIEQRYISKEEKLRRINQIIIEKEQVKKIGKIIDYTFVNKYDKESEIQFEHLIRLIEKSNRLFKFDLDY